MSTDPGVARRIQPQSVNLMSQFSSFERRIAAALSYVPGVKRFIKRGYQMVNDVFYRPSYLKKAASDVQAVSSSADDPSRQTFYGYYDHRPESADGRLILQHEFDGPTTRRPSPSDTVDVCVVDAETGETTCRFSSAAFNWQQGTRLQWMDERTFVYNDVSDDGTGFVARTASASGEALRTYAKPIQDGYSTDYFLSLNYRRIRALRPDYGYFSLPGLTGAELERLDDDGLWRVDYDTGDSELIYTLQQICELDAEPAFKDGTHYVNHAMIAPSGEQFVFLHRYLENGRRHDRLLLGDPSGETLQVLVATGFVSHYCWMDGQRLLGYMRGRSRSDGYFIVDVETGDMMSVLEGRLNGNGDGHPSVHGRRLVTDTYPDKGRMQNLLLVDLEEGTVDTVAELRHGLQYDAETRCDIHPRLSHDGSVVFFDSVFSGRRTHYRMALPEAP